jgi:hypothetical protein
MKFTQISLFVLAGGFAPLAVHAGVEIGINIGGPEVIVRSAPPPERFEPVPMAPGPGFVWIRGRWSWRHDRWEWINGHWDRAAQPGSTWIAGQWVPRGGGWFWVEGHYAVMAPPPPPGPPGPEMVAGEPPPPPMYEAVPVAPGPDFFWIGGHWRWTGRWVWVSGRFDRHPHFHPGGGWEAGHWDRRGGSWVWHDGHWR